MEGKALSLAESATTSLLRKLGSVLAEEAGLLAWVRNDIEYIMDELKSMAAFLRVLSSRQDHDEQVKAWMEQVREMAYDAEDCIDVFEHRLGRPRDEHGVIGFFTYCYRLPRTLKARHCVATDLQNLKLRARDVSERRARYALTSATATPGGANSGSYTAANSSDPRLPALFVEEVQPMGIDGRKDMLIGWLLEEDQPQLGVISLVGLGGLGKTTLAMMVYESPDVPSSHFQARAWIAVSQSYKIETLLGTLIQRLDQLEQHLDVMGEAELVKTIRDYLHNKRYLIVLDDIWSIRAWDGIKVALPDNKNGSRIIVTTRIHTVANVACSQNHRWVYEIPPLPWEQSWELFCKRVFDGPCPDSLRPLSELILAKCDGLPLAIVAIAGVLAAKPKKTQEEWQKFYDQLGFELKTNAGLERIYQILLLSYNDLPYHLKRCLLYLSIFPEDHEIKRMRLVRRWVAEGLVNAVGGMSEEEVAEGYFNELINRSLILSSEFHYLDGKMITCRVHDIMLEIILSISTEENFVTILGERSTAMPADGKIRRLALHSTSTPGYDVYLSHARSLTTFCDHTPLQDYGKVRLLRVLDLERCRGITHDHLKSISKLFLLNFLSLKSCYYVKELPNSIGDLQNLQTLDIRHTGIRELPSSVSKLQRLVYLLGGTTLSSLHERKAALGNDWFLPSPKRVGKMKRLRKLRTVGVGDIGVLREIGELTQLKKLSLVILRRHKWGISFHGHKPSIRCCPKDFIGRTREHLRTSLEKLSNCLRSLEVFDQTDDAICALHDLSKPPLLLQKIHLCGLMRTLPTWFASLYQITRIVLFGTLLEQNSMQVLKDLPMLIALVLGDGSFKEQLCFDCEGFGGLRTLNILEQDVIFEFGGLPNVETLSLRFYHNEKSVAGLQHLQNLKEVNIMTESEVLRDMLRGSAEAHPNHPKVICSTYGKVGAAQNKYNIS